MQGLGLERDLGFELAEDTDPDAEGAPFRLDGSAYAWKAPFERLFLQTPATVAGSRPSPRGVPSARLGALGHALVQHGHLVRDDGRHLSGALARRRRSFAGQRRHRGEV